MQTKQNDWYLRRLRLVGFGAGLIALALVAAVVLGYLERVPLVYVALGFLLSVAMRQAALMTGLLLWGWRDRLRRSSQQRSLSQR